MPKSSEDIQEMLSAFVNQTSRLLYQVGDTLRESAIKSKDMVSDKLKERDLNQQFQSFGKDVFGLYAAGKVELPDELNEHIDKIKALIAEIAHEKKTEAPAEDDAPPPEKGAGDVVEAEVGEDEKGS